MSDAPRDVRDRLGEAARLFHWRRWLGGMPQEPWADLAEQTRAYWISDSGEIAAALASCGLKIAPDDDGETK